MRRLALTLAALAAGCTTQSAPTLRPVSLPDISQVTQVAARDQLRGAYASLNARINAGSTPAPELANSFGEMGRLLMAAEFIVPAEPFFQNAEALTPDDRRWPYYLGHIYRLRGNTDASAAAFERALKLAPSDEATLVWLGDAYLNENRIREAKDLLNRALSANARSVAALYRLGRAAAAEDDEARAADYFERGLAIDARATILHYPLSIVYRRLGQAAKADEHLRQRGDTDIGPLDPLMQQLGQLLETAAVFERRAIDASKANDWKSAAIYMKKAVDLEPQDAALRHKLGTALSMAGDNQAAIEQFEHTLRLAPGDVDARFNLAQLLLGSGRTGDAVVQLQRVVHDAPGDAEARAALSAAMGRLQGR